MITSLINIRVEAVRWVTFLRLASLKLLFLLNMMFMFLEIIIFSLYLFRLSLIYDLQELVVL